MYFFPSFYILVCQVYCTDVEEYHASVIYSTCLKSRTFEMIIVVSDPFQADLIIAQHLWITDNSGRSRLLCPPRAI